MNFKNYRKMYFSQNVKCLVFFKSARPVYYQLHLNLIYNFTQNHFSSKKHIFAFLTKNCGLKDNFSEKTGNFCPLNCTYLGKISFQCYKRLVRNNEFKSDQLEMLLSVYCKYILILQVPFFVPIYTLNIFIILKIPFLVLICTTSIFLILQVSLPVLIFTANVMLLSQFSC